MVMTAKNVQKEKKCTAFFKDDKDHEKCNWWEKNMLEKNLDK